MYKLKTEYWDVGSQGSCKFSVRPSQSQVSHSDMSDSLQLHGLQHTRPPCPPPTPEVYPNSCPSSQWCHPNTSSSVVPSLPAFNLSQNQDLFQWVGSSHQVAKELEFHFQHQSFQWTLRMFMVRTVQNTNLTPVLSLVFLVVQMLGHFQLFAIWWLPNQALLFSTISVCSNSCPSWRWCHLSIQSSGHSILLLPSFFPGI